MYKSYLLLNLLSETFHFIYKLQSYKEIGEDIILYLFGTENIKFISIENTKLINNENSWKKEDTNFRIFEQLNLQDRGIKNIKGEINYGTCLKCNISMNEEDDDENVDNFKLCESSSIRWCY